MVSKKTVILIGSCVVILAAIIILASLHASQGSRIDFKEITNYHGRRVTLQGFLGENITLQQSLQNTASIDSAHQYYYLYANKTAQDEKIILVFNDSLYVDQGALVSVTGKVDVIDPGTIYLNVTTIK